MFEMFGNMDLAGLLATAAAEKEEGDLESLIKLAEENGLCKEDAEDYMDDIVDVFCTPLQAATAKLDRESKEMGASGTWDDWKSVIQEMCIADEDLCIGIRKPEKNLAQMYGNILKIGFTKKERIPEAICKAAGITQRVELGVPTKKDVKEAVLKYYKE